MSANSNEVKIYSCRICLDTKYSNGVSFDDGDNWLKMYEFCFGLILSVQDMPRKLCGVCAMKMEDFSKLKNQSIQSDKLWKTIISVNPKIDLEQKLEGDENFLHVKEENCDFDGSSDNFNYEFHNGDDDRFSIKEEEVSTIDIDKNCFIKKDKDIVSDEKKEIKLDENNKNVLYNSENFEKSTKKIGRVKKKFSCKSCKTTFKNLKNYRRHIIENICKLKDKPKAKSTIKSEVRGKSSEFVCGLCDVKSLNESDIREHLNVHSSNNDLSCKLCGFTGRDFADMETHRYTHQDNPSLKCHSCDAKSPNILALQYHYRSVHLEKPGGWCTVCDKTYRSYKSWKNHEKWHKTAKYICDHCGRRFLYRYMIKAHIKDHLDYKGNVCDVCGKRFKRMSNLRLHLAQVHDKKSATCTHCGKIFKNEANLKVHMHRVTKEKKLQCEVCSKWYAYDGALKKHMIWHKDERPFVCNICGSAYKAKSYLRVHMRRHTGDFPYKCTVPNCSKAFACSNQLTVHLNTHTGVRRYKCPYCDKTFHNRCNVVMHCAKRHNITDVVVEGYKKIGPRSEGFRETMVS